MEDPLGDRLVDFGDGLKQGVFGEPGVFLAYGLAHLLDESANF
jgi:hypothetical protein